MYPYTYPEFNLMYRSSLQEAVDFIKDCIVGEYSNIQLYEHIYTLAPSKEDKSVIASIIRDEKSHINTLKNLYEEITGVSLVQDSVSIDIPEQYRTALKKSILSNISRIDTYNKLYESIQELRYTSVVQRIINDELKHLSLLNVLLW